MVEHNGALSQSKARLLMLSEGVTRIVGMTTEPAQRDHARIRENIARQFVA
jgi:hypothetical protein